MAYFCGLYISSGARTPDSMLCDLFGLKTFFSLSLPLSFFFFKSNVCMCEPGCANLPQSMCSITRRPGAQLSWRWDTGAPMAPQTLVMSRRNGMRKQFRSKFPHTPTPTPSQLILAETLFRSPPKKRNFSKFLGHQFVSRHRVGFNNSPLTVCTAGQLVKRYGIRTRCNESVMRPGAATFFFFWQVNAMMTDDHRGPCTKKRGTSEDHTRLCEKKKNVDGSRAGRQTLSRSHNYFEFSEMGCSIK